MSTLQNIYVNPESNSHTITTLSSTLSQVPEAEILKFHKSLPGYTPTPILPLPHLAKSLHLNNILIKDERTRYGVSSFKPLGIAWAIRNALIAELSESSPTPIPSTISLSELASKTSEARIKLVTATDGKLGAMVARLGKYFGVRSVDTRIFVARGLDEGVKEGIRKEGAEVIEVDGEFEMVEREAWLHSVATDGVLVAVEEEENYVDIPRWIVEGYSTIFKELDEQLDGVRPDLVIVPVGVGGLAQAAVTHYKSATGTSHQRTYIATVEPAVSACLYESLKAGERVTISPKDTIMKNMNYAAVSETAWEILKHGVDVSMVMDDEDVKSAMIDASSAGIRVGACGGAVLSSLKLLVNSAAWKDLGLTEDSTIVLVCTDSPQD